ncbi:MAG TPA: DNA recombination protein RmuC, partial [Gammaproteobacteria bacterium]|nr:DNA recombination protein RmuC [Gammaproteobacteria bacterium]
MRAVLDAGWQLPALAAIAGLVAGCLLGWGIGRIARGKLEHTLALKDAELKNQAQQDVEREQVLALATERLGGVFSQLASQHLHSHSETFLKLARESLGTHHERAKSELAAREQAVENLVRPIREALLRTEAQVAALEQSRQQAYGTITAQLEAMAASQRVLSTETRNLVNALRRPEVRGQWGEITLRRLVELAG